MNLQTHRTTQTQKVVVLSSGKEKPSMPHQRQAFCPSCGKLATFTAAGEQRWPARVAAAAGMPEVVQLWLCNHCHSTISEPNLTF